MWSVQDYYNVLAPSSISTKVLYAHDHLRRTAACRHFGEVEKGLIHLNFLSASNFWNKACWPERIAKVVNREVEEWLCVGHCLEDKLVMGGHADGVFERGVSRKGEGDGGTGIVIMDFVGEGGDWDLVHLIIGMNIGVLSRFEKQFELDT
jgi:1-phosphatidylinositol phosphodiesterase